MRGSEPVAVDEVGLPWSGVGDRTIVELVERAAKLDPDLPILEFEDGVTVTRRQLREEAERFAGYLLEHLRRGDRVAIAVRNRAEFMIATVAAAAARMTLVPINPASKPRDAEHMLRDSGATAMIVDDSTVGLLEAVRAGCPDLRLVITLSDDEPGGLPSGTASLRLRECEAVREDVIAVHYTSGTTGLPKGCMVDHEWALRVVDAFIRVFPHTPRERMLSCLHFCYADPTLLMLDMLATGGTLVTMRSFSVSRFWPVVRTLDVTITFTIETIPVWLLKQPPSEADHDHHVKYAIHSAIPPEMHATLEERFGFPWYEDYGMMESNVIALMRPADAPRMVGTGSVGRPAPEVEVRVVDDNDADVPRGEVGEMLVRSPGRFRGYHLNPAATEELVSDGWLRTGDLGRLDSEGFIFFAGRKKLVIRRAGQNVAPVEVEETLLLHDAVQEAAVVPQPDANLGEEVAAHVRLRPGATVSPSDLLRFVGESLASYKVPRYLAIWEVDFPRTPSMRVRKRDLSFAGPVWDRMESSWASLPADTTTAGQEEAT
jgi:crotonobetaine/carnitine-CoA ligase